MNSLPPRKRTVWIWLIAIWFSIGAVFTLVSFFAVRSGAVPLSESQRAYFDSLGIIEHGASILIAGSNLLASAFLIVLRTEAVYLFCCAFCVNALLTAWHLATKGVAAMLGGGLVGIVFSLGLLGAVCVYTWKLWQRQVLR